MKLKFERYPGFACIYVRGVIEPEKFKILLIGLENLIREAEEPTIINMGYADISIKDGIVLGAFKKKVTTKFAMYWVSPDKNVGEYRNFDLLSARIFFNPKTKPVAERIRFDDEVFLLNDHIKSVQDELDKLGGSDENAKKILLENDMLKAQKAALDASISGQSGRLVFQVAVPSQDAELPEKTRVAIENLTKLALGEVPL